MTRRQVCRAVVATAVVVGALSTPGASERKPTDVGRFLHSIEVVLDSGSLVVTLAGDPELAARAVAAARSSPLGLVIDLPDVAAAVPMKTQVGVGPIDVIRIEPHENDLATTRVVFDLLTPTRYRIETGHARAATMRVVFPLDQADRREPLAGRGVLDGHVGRLVTPATPAVSRGAIVDASVPPRPEAGVTRLPLVRPVLPPHAQLQPQAAPRREYTGEPVSMDFQSADLRAVLRTFAEISQLNIVIDPQVDGVVDVSLRDVPWDQALDIILRANQLGYVVDGTVVRIAPLTVLSDEEAQRRKLAEEQALSGELIVMTRTLSYARAPRMAELITPLLSPRGQVQTDERTNTLILTDLSDRLTAADELLDTLDRAEPQVEIEARIIQAGKEFARSIGVQWGITGRIAPDLGNTTPLTFPNRGGVSGRLGAQGPEQSGGDPRATATENAGSAVNLPAANATSALGLTLGSVDGGLNLDIVLSAAELDGQLRTLSHPRVTTQNNVEAEIVQGDQIPIQVVANNTVTVQFQDAALVMRVTPQITASQTVIMQIEIENDFADFSREVTGIPPIVTQRARTTVQVGTGETTVIGGIFESSQSSSSNRVPALHRIPLLGWLFKSQTDREDTDELLIFLTPRIIR